MVLIFVGYAANDAVRVFFIDTGTDVITNFLKDDSDNTWGKRHVRLDCELALDLLLQVLRIQSEAQSRSRNRFGAWVPVARHNVLSAIPYSRLTNDRFRIEVILQAIKSRGFFTLEAIDKIHRIEKHSEKVAHSVLRELRDEGVFTQESLRHNYALTMKNGPLATKLLQTCCIPPDTRRERWSVLRGADGTWSTTMNTETCQEFVERSFNEIAGHPRSRSLPMPIPPRFGCFDSPRRSIQ